MSGKNTQPAAGEAGQEAVISPRLSSDSRSSSSRSSSLRREPAKLSHRQSLGDSLRGVPSSPRARRQPSFTQAAVQSLIDNPPSHAAADPAFSGRDWTQISIGELVQPVDLKFVDADTSIEDATNVCIALFPYRCIWHLTNRWAIHIYSFSSSLVRTHCLSENLLASLLQSVHSVMLILTHTSFSLWD